MMLFLGCSAVPTPFEISELHALRDFFLSTVIAEKTLSECDRIKTELVPSSFNFILNIINGSRLSMFIVKDQAHEDFKVCTSPFHDPSG